MPFWSVPVEELLRELDATAAGLGADEAAARAARLPRADAPPRLRALRSFAAQLASPIVLTLLVAAALSAVFGDPMDVAIIVAIVLASAGLGFWQEHSASRAVEALLASVRTLALALRGGERVRVPLEQIVPGDVVELSAGSAVPGDCRLLDARDLYLVEAALTGETFPVEKHTGDLAADCALAERSNTLFAGTHVASGQGRALVVRVGSETEFGQISRRLRLRPPETEFEVGVRRFGALLAELTGILVALIFALNAALGHPVLESILFSLALAVGLTPQLLPAVISVNLAHGARRMARAKTIVKRPSAIENLGSMDVLCSDKTGTLTEGVVRVHSACDAAGKPSARVLQLAAINAGFETGFTNPIDEAIRAAAPLDRAAFEKLDEVPYDFVRKRLSVLVRGPSGVCLVTKGAVPQVLEVCTQVEWADGSRAPLAPARERVGARFDELSRQGLRTLAVAVRELGAPRAVGRAEEADLVLVGFLALHDPPRAGVVDALGELRELGIALKIVTGDNRLVAASVWERLGLPAPDVLTGPELRQLSDDALRARAPQIELFAEVEPNQKERILLALKKAGHVVGFLGDGINDASALHVADVGLSVEGAVDVAKQAADIVLLERDLRVLAEGVREGRVTFANTLKYVFMATSANFGNMFSMAGASLVLPFLPLLPKQVLLTNLLTDLPEMAIAADRVDAEWIARPRRWDVAFIRRFMLVFGLLSSVFDYATFAVLRLALGAQAAEFRAGWFVESVVSASLIVLVIRTRTSALSSRPAPALALATLGVCAAAILLPASPVAGMLGFAPLPGSFYLALGAIVLAYVASAEIARRVFYRIVG